MTLHQLPKHLHADLGTPGKQPRSQVALDYSNPLTKGAALFVGADGYDLVSNVMGDLVNGAKKGVNIHGKSIFLDNNASANTTTPEAVDFPDFRLDETQFSITFIGQWTGPSAAFNRLLSAKNAFGDSKGFECQTSSTNSNFVMTGASSKFWHPSIGSNWAFGGDPFTLTAQWDGTSSKVYLNGELAASQTSSSIDNAGLTSQGIRIGGILVANDRAFEGHMNYVYIKKGVLTDTEAASLHRDPYQILKPRTPEVYFTASEAGDTILPTVVSETVTVHQPSLTAGGVSISPTVVSETVTVHQPTISSTFSISPDLVSSVVSVFNPSLTAGGVSISPTLVSASVTVEQPRLTTGSFTISPNLVSATVTVDQITTSSLFTVKPDLTALTATVEQPAMPFAQVISPTIVSNVVTVYQPSLSTGEFIRPTIVSSTVTVQQPSLTSGSVSISPDIVSLTAAVNNPRLFDPAAATIGFYSNDTMIAYFRAQTGLDSHQFNELAKAYYAQASGADLEAFNELQRAAQDAAVFVGLAPTDWRNF